MSEMLKNFAQMMNNGNMNNTNFDNKKDSYNANTSSTKTNFTNSSNSTNSGFNNSNFSTNNRFNTNLRNNYNYNNKNRNRRNIYNYNSSSNNCMNNQSYTSTNNTESSEAHTSDINDNEENRGNGAQNSSFNGFSDFNNIFGNIDMNTLFKMQQIMSSLNSKENDSRTNLLMSLKPYLKESRKNKVDQYIQLMKMEKVFEIMNPLGGEKKNVWFL